MAPRSNSCGSSFLARRSNLVKARTENKGAPPNVLIIGHDNIDAARLIATLRILFGYDHEIRCTPTLGDAVHRVNERAPDNVFLTEALKPSSDTSQAVTLLRGAGLSGPIIIIGGHMTRARRARLIICDADDVIDKDDIDSVRIGEALALIRSPSKSG